MNGWFRPPPVLHWGYRTPLIVRVGAMDRARSATVLALRLALGAKGGDEIRDADVGTDEKVEESVE